MISVTWQVELLKMHMNENKNASYQYHLWFTKVFTDIISCDALNSYVMGLVSLLPFTEEKEETQSVYLVPVQLC